MSGQLAEPKRHWSQQMWTGIALFFSTYYILGLNPSLLSQAGVPAAVALAGTFIAVIGGNLSGAYFTGTGLMIAPAVGIGAFFGSYLKAMHGPNASVPASTISWQNLFFGCMLAGAAILVTSVFTDWRRQIVEDLPESVRRAATGSIGSLLLKSAFDSYDVGVKAGVNAKQGMIATSLGVCVLLAAYWFRKRVKTAGRNLPGLAWFELLTRLEFVLVASAMAIYVHFGEPAYYATLSQVTKLAWIGNSFFSSGWSDFSGSSCILVLVFAAILWFIVMTDIPGTPGIVLPKDWDNRERTIQSGFRNDGVWALISPMFGTTPTIYYAENRLLETFDEYRAGVGYWVAGLFGLTFAACLIAPIWWPAFSIERLLPPFATVPILMFIGILVIGASYGQKSEERAPEHFIPAAIGVVLTPRLGLEVAFPLAILSWWLIPSAEKAKPAFKPVTAGAAAVLVIYLSLRLFSPVPS